MIIELDDKNKRKIEELEDKIIKLKRMIEKVKHYNIKHPIISSFNILLYLFITDNRRDRHYYYII